MAKKFIGNRPFKDIARMVKASGGKVDDSASTTSCDADLWKNITFNGRRFLYNTFTGKFIMPPDQAKSEAVGKDEYVTEESSHLDNIRWYEKILELLYIQDKAAPQRKRKKVS